MNKLMTRIYSAMNNGEDPILDQITSDIALAKESAEPLITEEYNMTPMNDGSIIIHDRVNNENTKAVDTPSGITLVEVPSIERHDLQVGKSVSWTDNSGDKTIGKLIKVNGGTATVEVNGKLITVNSELLTQMEPSRRLFSKAGHNYYLVDSNGEVKAHGLKTSLGKLAKEHPEWKLLHQYDFNKHIAAVTKKFSNFSEDNQKLFTKQNRRFAILDQSGKIQHIVDITNVGGLLKKNPGWTAIKESEWRKTLGNK